MMARVRVFLVCLVGFVLMGEALRAEVYVETVTKIEFPETVGDFTRSNVKTYQLQTGTNGVSLSYSSKDTAVTVFVRGIDDPTKDAATYVSESLAEVKMAGERGIYSDIKVQPIPAPGVGDGWSAGAFTAQQDGKPFKSYILCKVFGKSLLKIRCSSPTRDEASLIAICGRFREVLDKEAAR